MVFHLKKQISSKVLANYLCAEHSGPSVAVLSVGDLMSAHAGCLCFAVGSAKNYDDQALVICNSVANRSLTCIFTDNPRLIFIKGLSYLLSNRFIDQKFQGNIHPTARVSDLAIIEKGAEVGAGVSIGPGSYVKSCVVLGDNTVVGANCTLGHAGFGFERDENGIAIRFPHLGKLVIGQDCEIGNSCCISRGTLRDTVVERGIKIDDHAYLAHNVFVKENSLIMAGVRLNGGVVVGKQCWIGTNAIIREGCIIHDYVTVGMGSVVVKKIEKNSVVFGNPAD